MAAKSCCFGLVLVVLGAASCIPQPKDKTRFTGVDAKDPIVNDIQINRAIREHFAADGILSSQSVEVATSDGIVTVHGAADNLPSKDKAIRIAGAIRGVRAVVDNLAVKPVTRPDPQIRSDVESALRTDPATRADAVEAAVANGVVTLSGRADSWQEKELLSAVAMTVNGVKQIDNAVVVTCEPAKRRSDSEITSAVQHRLGFDVWLDGSFVDVKVSNGVVTLSGVVATPELRRRAIADAWVPGVASVREEGLAINWWAQTRARRANEIPVRTDPEIAQAVRDSFVYDARLKVHAPDVSVRDGEVMLAGTLDNMPARLAAEEDASNTVGVERVIDDVVVQPAFDISDDAIERAARVAIARNRPGLPKEVSLATTGGTIAIRGSVRTPDEAREILTTIASVPGVKDIKDELHVRPSVVPATPAAVKAAVEGRLLLDPRVDFQHVTVVVAPDLTVTLKGEVASAQESRVAGEAATSVGAPRVVNELRLVRAYAPLVTPPPANPGGLTLPAPFSQHP